MKPNETSRWIGSLLAGAICTVVAPSTFAQGGRVGAAPANTAAQTAAIASMEQSLANLTTTQAAARLALTTAAFAESRSEADIQAKTASLSAAELALANERANQFEKIQASADKLSAEQVTVLVQQGGRGGAAVGRGGGAGGALRSPEVAADGRVTFRLRYPSAQQVSIMPEPGTTARMTKGEDGIWTATLGPLAPDVYAYRFSVDGVSLPDPANGAPLKTQRPNVAGEVGQLTSWQSQFVVPNVQKPEPWEMQAIPHGAVAHVNFWSKTMGAFRDYYVYTPPGYDGKRTEPYPVLYLLHGAGENASGWMDIGKANLILDSLISEGKATPMIIVTPLGHAAQQTLPGQAVPGEAVASAAGGRGAGGGGQGSPYFTSLLNEIMPQVESGFNAGNTKATRAIAGLSMGGAQTLSLATLHPEKFSYVGMFSSAIGGGGRGAGAGAGYTLPTGVTKAWNDEFKLVWIACGQDDGLFAANAAFKQALKANGINHEDIVTSGAHSYSVWKRNLAAFTPLLFR